MIFCIVVLLDLVLQKIFPPLLVTETIYLNLSKLHDPFWMIIRNK